VESSVLIPTLAGIIGVAVGSATTIYLERDRRRRESVNERRHERKSVYAAFMAAVVRWQHEIVGRHKLRFGPDPQPDAVARADEALQRIRQEAMGPLFELRMLGTPTVVGCAERVMDFTYGYEAAYEGPSPGYTAPNPDWLARRDEFIAAVRAEILVT
jgi:hypothetical protein